MEIVPNSWRAFAGLFPSILYGIGYALLSLLAKFSSGWQFMVLLCGYAHIPFLLSYFILPESVRWAYTKDNQSNADLDLQRRLLLKSWCKNCGADIDDVFIDEFEEGLRKVPDSSRGSKSYTYVDLFTSGKHLRFVSLNVIFNFTVNVLTYYGLTFNAAALPGDIFVNNGIQGLIDFVSCIVMVYLLNKCGRRSLIASCEIMGGAACLVSMIVYQFSLQDGDDCDSGVCHQNLQAFSR